MNVLMNLQYVAKRLLQCYCVINIRLFILKKNIETMIIHVHT